MAKFTEGFADKLRVPEGARDVQAFDDELPGFGIRKFASGKAAYFVKFTIGTQQRRKTLGRAVRGNLRAMRLEASAILAKARLGTDVVAIARADAARTSQRWPARSRGCRKQCGRGVCTICAGRWRRDCARGDLRTRTSLS